MPGDVEDKNIFDAERVQDHNSEDSTEIPNMFLPGILGIPLQVNKCTEQNFKYQMEKFRCSQKP